MKNEKKFFRCQNLGNGRFELSVIINFRLLGKILGILLGIGLIGGLLYLLGWGVIALAKLAWSVKWWLLGTLLLALIIWALSKVNWKAIKWPERKSNLKWLWLPLGIILLVILAALLFRGCEDNKSEVAAEVVTEDIFKDAASWIKLDAYLSEGFNVKYADFKKFDSYGKVLSYNERLQAFDVEAYYADWGRLFPYFDGKSFSDNQLAALKRYGLWSGLAGFEASPAGKKLRNGEDVVSSDLAKVYKANGKEREYTSISNLEHARKYAWVIMNVFDGNITIAELLDYPIKSYESLSVDDMYDSKGNYIFNQKLKKQLKASNGNRTTREILGL